MNRMGPFDVLETPLLRGTSLLEASAGTGKTYTLAGLFLRLLLEENLPAGKILVVTFTEAATEELRGRVRDLLVRAAEAMRRGPDGGRIDDAFLRGMVARAGGERDAWRRRIELALGGFDEASIYTIHGFCRRVLQERAFETGALFESELVQDTAPLVRQVAEDYWRTTLYGADSWLACLALATGLSPAALGRWVGRLLQRRAEVQLPRLGEHALEEATARVRRVAADLAGTWNRDGATVRGYFGAEAAWAKQPYNLESLVGSWFELLEEAFAGRPTPEAVGVIEQLTPAALASGVRKRRKDATPPTHTFFEQCAELVAARERWALAWHVELAYGASKRLARLKERRKVVGFDDLLGWVEHALVTEAGPGREEAGPLVRALRGRYQAALVDEFQDTDPVQWTIFRRAFQHPAGWLYYIGDPKQAIYHFRGADVFTYLTAGAAAERRYTLATNYRSAGALVEAVHGLFDAVPAPFVVPEIQLHRVAAGGRADAQPLTESGRSLPPLELWWWGEESAVPAIRYEDALPRLVACEVVRLLEEEVRIGGRRLRPGDIAILVRKHQQAARMKKVLLEARVPAVLHTDASVFESEEAIDLRWVLLAVAQPRDERRARAALATELWGASVQQLDEWTRDERGWLAQLDGLARLRQKWVELGFLAMFQQWLDEQGVRQRLLRRVDGDRRLTNLLHLGELLHRAEAEARRGADSLVSWLEDRMAAAADEESADAGAEENLLRLERDDEAVRIVTIHKSKGLEYPVVFCPFSWDRSQTYVGSKPPATYDEGVGYHEPTEHGYRYVRDLGSEEFAVNRRRAEREVLAENVRLLYVALTRAVHRCYLAWGHFKGYTDTALHWLWHRPAGLGPDAEDLVESLRAHGETRNAAEMRRDLEAVASRVNRDAERLRIVDVREPIPELRPWRPEPVGEHRCRPRVFPGAVPQGWRVCSFTGLAANRELEGRDDEPEAAGPVEPAESPETALPKGPEFGTCLHQILERMDFTVDDRPLLDQLVREALRDHGFAAETVAETLTELLLRLRRTPLDPAVPGLRLECVPASDCVRELEFHCPVRALRPTELRALFRKPAPGEVEVPLRFDDLAFDVQGGYLQGFVDLVFRFGGRFYVVDWKSNFLGPAPADYGEAGLRRAMAGHQYGLQAYLYAAALHRWLQQRLVGYRFDRHFGGLYYVFVRGIDPEHPELGIYRERPTEERIRRLSACFASGIGEESLDSGGRRTCRP